MAAKKNSKTVFEQVAGEIASGKLKPVYYLFGEEEFYLDLLLEKFSAVIPSDQKDFNFDLLYGQDISPAQALGIASSFPMMAERRVLIIRNFLQINKGGGDGSSQRGHINDFIAYFENPNPTTLLVLIDTKKPAGNTNLGKKIARNQNVGFHEFEKLPDYMIPDWVIAWAKEKHGKKINAEAAQLLGQFVGNDLQLLSTEIDKVCTFVDTSDSINNEHVKKVIGSYRDYTAIELKEAVMKRDLEQSLYISEQILQHSKSDTGELIRIVGFFNSVFINIWQIRRLSEKGLSQSKVQAELGIKSSWYFNKLWDDASRFHYNDMPRVFEALLDADRAIKGFSTLDPTSILFLLIRRMIG
ncbi:DNA polymerase III subunit delta [Balneola sp. MJW-20]|uniref:DNA polymerase III subunit delta n=1 Tax=Gracilimonas aurantiaca TaxID=3234185 RepID=UPI0034667144